jgi:hypothetical protein
MSAIDPKAVEAARRIADLNYRAGEHDYDADAELVANSLLTASQARDDVIARNVRKEGRSVVILCDSYEEVDRVYASLKTGDRDAG